MAGEDKEYVVEFLILRQIKVRTHDDIAAQIDAFNALPPTQRGRIVKVRVCHADGEPTWTDTKTSETWENPDMDWLKSNVR